MPQCFTSSACSAPLMPAARKKIMRVHIQCVECAARVCGCFERNLATSLHGHFFGPVSQPRSQVMSTLLMGCSAILSEGCIDKKQPLRDMRLLSASNDFVR